MSCCRSSSQVRPMQAIVHDRGLRVSGSRGERRTTRGNLDGATGIEVADLMFRLNRENGTTLLLVTHDVNLASRCERRLSLALGRLVSDERVEPAKSSTASAVRVTAK